MAQELLGGARGANSFLFQHSYLAAYDFDSARKILLHSNYERTDLEELARDIGFRPVAQTDAGKLAREVDQLPACDKTVWYLIKKNIETTPSPSGGPSRRVTETR